jgi:hypothetical protein
VVPPEFGALTLHAQEALRNAVESAQGRCSALESQLAASEGRAQRLEAALAAAQATLRDQGIVRPDVQRLSANAAEASFDWTRGLAHVRTGVCVAELPRKDMGAKAAAAGAAASKPETTAERLVACGICLDAPKATAFGCGHLVCEGCAAQLAHCPWCRAPVTSRSRVFF